MSSTTKTEVVGNVVFYGYSISVGAVSSANKIDDLNDIVMKLQGQIRAIQTQITNVEIKLESQLQNKAA
jgi:hypothetical protein